MKKKCKVILTISVTANITDQRFSSLCGIVTGTVDQIDASALTKQFNDFFLTYQNKVTDGYQGYTEEMEKNLVDMQESFGQWFKTIKDILNETENGELLQRIEELYKNLYSMALNSDIDRIINGDYLEEEDSGTIFNTATADDIDRIINGDYLEQEETGGDATISDIDKILDALFE